MTEKIHRNDTDHTASKMIAKSSNKGGTVELWAIQRDNETFIRYSIDIFANMHTGETRAMVTLVFDRYKQAAVDAFGKISAADDIY